MSENRQPSITANGPGGVCYAVCLKGNFIDRDTKQNGAGWNEGGCRTRLTRPTGTECATPLRATEYARPI